MMFADLRRRIDLWCEPESSHFDLAMVLTLLMFLFYAREPGFPFMVWAPLSVAVIVAALIWPRVRASPYVWLFLTIAMVWARLPQLTVMDNHHYLIAYWFVAVTACLVSGPEDAERRIARSARLLIGLAMGFAVVAKLLSGEFADGDFFEFLLLAGKRFDAFAEIVLRVPAADLVANREAIAALVTPGATANWAPEVTLVGPEHVKIVAVLLAGWTLAIEGAAAIAFLSPVNTPRWRAARNGSLIVFCLTTYAIATVGAFAWILIILGIAQCEKEDRLVRFAYSGAFVMVLVFGLPWGDLLRSIGLA